MITCWFQCLLQVLDNYIARLSTFARSIDDEYNKGIEATLKAARVTMIEHKLMHAFLASTTDLGDAKKLVQAQSRSFGPGGINPVQDLHKSLWKYSQDVSIRGIKMELPTNK